MDIVFNETVGSDTTPPTVASTNPLNGAVGISVSANVSAQFSEAMDPDTIAASNVELRDASDNPVAASLSYTSGNYTATIDPAANLAYSTSYTARIKGDDGLGGGVTDLVGNPMAVDYVWSFTTSAPPPPPPDEGPGGPILVISDAGNPFGRYYAEILRTEGLNEFTATDISLVTTPVLADYDVVILAELSRALTSGEVTMLTDWVTAGGNLITMRPDTQLTTLLGLTYEGGTLPATGQLYAYLLVDTNTAPGLGIVNQTIQYHGLADLYTLNGASMVARLYSDATTASDNPAVSLHNVGSNGGEAATFTYDLARSVVYTRQGNPAWAGQNRDASGPAEPRIISNDLFYGNLLSDPQPDYIDWNKITIPQADEQMRLLANLIQYMNRDKKPLPRFWYFPRGEKAVVIMTGDDHGSGNTVGRFNHYIDISPPGCSVQDWECIRSSSFMYMNSSVMTPALADSFTTQGFEVGIHINTGCVDWTPSSLASNYQSQLASWDVVYSTMPRQMSERTHCVTWSDWVTQAKVQASHGIRMDTNYYYYPASWVQERPGMFTGSGKLMRFADLDGTMVDVYQAVTQMTDESSTSYGVFNPIHITILLDNAVSPTGYYGAFTTNMHTDSVDHVGSETIINAAVARSVPVVSGRQMVTWLDGRNASHFETIDWSGGVLSFDVQFGAGANGLQTLVPYYSNAGYITNVTHDGSPITFAQEVIKGIEYAIFDALPGSYAITYEPDITAPVISEVSAVPTTDGTAAIQWITDDNSDSRVDYGTVPESLSLQANLSGLITSHTINLTGLTGGTTYYYRVSSADLSDNLAYFPQLVDPPASFIVPTHAFIDTSVADFSAGTSLGNTYITQDDDGELILAFEVGTEFDGTSLPSGWFSVQYPSTGTGGTAVVGGGLLTLDGTRVGTDALYGPGRSLEFMATFTGGPHQHIGFGVDYFGGPWAIFSTNSDGTSFLVRTKPNAIDAETPTPISSSYIGAPHRFRIDWLADRVVYSIDGVQVASHMVAVGLDMRPMAAEYESGGFILSVDWMHLSPYQSPGTFHSRIFDAVGTATWGTPSWNADLPTGTSLSLSARTGDTPIPDGTWSAFTPLSYGTSIGSTSRYIQYQAVLGTSDTTYTPILSEIEIGFTKTPDSTPPTITNRSPSPNVTEVPLDANVNVTFSEEMDDTTINNGTLSLRAHGASEDVSAAVTYADRVATINPDDNLELGQRYYVTVSGSVEDLSGNPLGSDDYWTFVTSTFGGFIDTNEADFSAGTLETGAYLALTGNGEVTLAPFIGEEFSSTSLPVDWFSVAYGTPGSATVNNGWLTVDGRRVGPNAIYAPGRWLEFYGVFSSGPYKHIGFGVDFGTSPWAIFSTDSSTGTSLQARSANSVSIPDTTLSIQWNGVAHLSRIEWNATSISYLVDGAVVDNDTITIGDNMRPMVAEYGAGGGTLMVDWLRMGPYETSGSFVSRVFDAGRSAVWTDLSATTNLPTGTAVSFETHTSTDGFTWSPWSAVSSPVNSPNGQYLQYRVVMSSEDSNVTPVVEQVSLQYQVDAPTAALVSSFTADSQGNAVLVSWRTTNEVDLLGFNLYRSGSFVEKGESLNAALIPAQSPGSLTGNDYIYLDQTVQEGESYVYRLELVSTSGNILIEPIFAKGAFSIFLPVTVQ